MAQVLRSPPHPLSLKREEENKPAETAPGPAGLPANGTSTSDLQGPSAARMAYHLLENMLDDLDKRHPGVRDEVRQAFGSPRMPPPAAGAAAAAAAATSATPSGPTVPPLDLQGLQPNGQEEAKPTTPTHMDDSPAASSSSSTHFAQDPRKVKSEPPASPRDVEMEENASIPGPNGLPANGSITAGVPVPEPMQDEAGGGSTNEGTGSITAGVPVPEPVQNGASGASTNGPDGLPANGSWVVQDPIPSHADGWSDAGTTARL